MAAISELNVTTQERFMPLVTNQIWLESPVLYRIFKIAQEGKFGLALPSFDGRAIVEPLEIAAVTDDSVSHAHGAYGTSDTWAPSSGDILAGASYAWKIFVKMICLLKIYSNTGKAEIANPDEVCSLK